MLRKLVPESSEVEHSTVMENIYKSLHHILHRLETEVTYKQKTIEGKEQENDHLKSELKEKDFTIRELKNQMADCQRNIEGNRQLINKLLNDLERMQQDVEWYKRTYERRSLLGVLKDKLKHFVVR